MDVGAGTCATMAQVLVVLMLALVVDRRALVAQMGPWTPAVWYFVASFGITMGTIGASEGLTGLAGAVLFGIFIAVGSGAGGILAALLMLEGRRPGGTDASS